MGKVNASRVVLIAAFSIFNFQFSISLSAQQPHDISTVAPADPGTVMSIPVPQKEERRLRKYDIPELVGAHQALGSQLVNGELPRPLIDYATRTPQIEERVSFFEGGLVVVTMNGAAGAMHKKLILPADAVTAYRKKANPEALALIRKESVRAPATTRRSLLRTYRDDGTYVELAFDPAAVLPKVLTDEVRPLEDLARALSEDRTMTSSVPGYEPAVGDELVGDDTKTWRVERVTKEGVVQLRCIGQPTVIYVDKKSLYTYFVGKRSAR
jgi:hypothetical protein